MPYGLVPDLAGNGQVGVFQSLIWVACPTGFRPLPSLNRYETFQSLIWVACPTGAEALCLRRPGSVRFNPSYGLHALRATAAPTAGSLVLPVSIPHMGCMPYGRSKLLNSVLIMRSFNPSYGLHALRAEIWRSDTYQAFVSIPHMGCMPYGL